MPGLRSNSFNVDSANIYLEPLMWQTPGCVREGGSLNCLSLGFLLCSMKTPNPFSIVLGSSDMI